MTIAARDTAPRERRSWLTVRWDPWPSLFLAGVAVASVLILALLAIVMWLSFRNGSPGDADASYTLANYPDVFLDSFTYRVLANSAVFSAVSLVVAFLFGIPIAWLIERTDLRGKNALFTLMTIGLLLPGFASAMAWLFLLHPRIGLVNQWLERAFGLTAPPFNISTVFGMGWVQGLSLAPLTFIMTATVFRAMDPTLEESAQISGASVLQTARRVTLPLAAPGVLAAAIYVFMIGFSAFDVPAIIGWGARVFTFASYLVLELSPDTSLPQYGDVAALAAAMFALAGLLSWWYGRMQSLAHRYQVVTGKAYRANVIPLRGWRRAAWSYIGLYLFLSVFLPLLVLVWTSLLPYFQLPSMAGIAMVSLAHYHALPWAVVGEALRNTGVLMVLTPTLCLLLSVAFSWTVLRSRIPGRAVFDLIAFLPHAVPSIIFGIGALMLALYVVQPFVPVFGTLWLLLAVFVIARLSYATRMTNSGLIQIHREIEESARISGAGTGGVLRRIIAPLIAPNLLYAWLWIALLTFRELTLAVVLTTRGNMTLPIVIWNDWQSGGLGDAAAISVVMLLLMLPITWLYWLVARRQGLRGDA